MMALPRLFFSFLLAALFLSGCVQVRLRTANENYEQAAYAPAADDYEYVLRKRQEPQAMFNIADCYRQMGNSIKTEYWYRRALKIPGAKPEFNLYLAEALMQNGKCDEAKPFFDTYLELNQNDYRAQRMKESCDSMAKFYRDTTLYTVTPLRFNLAGENYFSPTFYRSGIVFLSDHYQKGLSKTLSDGTGKRYLDLFYSKRTERGNWLDPEPLRGDVNGRFNEGPAVFSKDGSTIYFTRNNYLSNKVEKNKRNINVLKIFRAVNTEGEWKIQDEVVFNSGDYSVQHPALNSDGSVMYFSSDMPWGYGGTDIYMVKSEGNNHWSQPVNLGPDVNTEGNEAFPFLWSDSLLYYASDGLKGLGGLDVFESKFVNDKWTKGDNVGAPVNSPQDDFAFILDSTGTAGFFSSSRGNNGDKIYTFVRRRPQLNIALKVTDKTTGLPVVNAMVKVIPVIGKTVELETNTAGTVRYKAEQETDYAIEIDHHDYYFSRDSASTIGKRFSEELEVPVELKRIVLNKPEIWKGISFKKKDWQLKVESAKALEALVSYLQENPRLQIEIDAFTDSRGTDADNFKLTQRRAELVQQYLTSKGIRAERLTAKGGGETKLLNKCVNGLLCLEEEHEINNRIEISVKAILTDTASR